MKAQRLFSYVRPATDDYNMINDGDKIAVGISGGKDSLTLLYALNGLKRFYPKKFDVVAITVDLDFGIQDFSKIEKCMFRKLTLSVSLTNTSCLWLRANVL